MPITMKTTDDYLYEKKRDILVLELRNSTKSELLFNRDDPETQKTEQRLLAWFNERGVTCYHTVPPSVLEGWLGHYYVDSELDSATIKEYMTEFEDSDGVSIESDKFQMLLINYEEWVSIGGLQDHLDYLETLKSPDYQS